VPVPVTGLRNVRGVSAGYWHSLALLNDGSVWAWGDNGYGQAGVPRYSSFLLFPERIPELSGVTAVSAGHRHSLALKADGTVWAWGYNDLGQIGDGTTTNRPSPVQVGGLTGVVAVSAGTYHSLALKSDGTVVAWGDHSSGQLGTGTVLYSTLPTAVPEVIPRPDLQIGSGAPANLVVGLQGIYPLTVSNAGLAQATGAITVVDTLPPGLTYVSASGTGWSCNASGQVVTCTHPGPLDAGTSSVITLTVEVGSAAYPGVTNIATVSNASDLNQSNNTTGLPATVAPPPHKLGAYNAGYWLLDGNGNYAWDGLPTDGSFTFGIEGTPLTGDWNGSGTAKAAIYKDGVWRFDYNGNREWDGPSTDREISFGWPGAIPLVGDWNGDGKDEIGVYSDGFWFLDYNGDGLWDGGVLDKQIGWGWPGATPVVGDWNGDGKVKIGVYSGGFWFLDYDGDYAWNPFAMDKQVGWGWDGVQTVVGDWNGDGRTKIGVYSNGFWFLDYDGDYAWNPGGSDKQVGWGWNGVVTVRGDWNGDGRTKIGVYNQGFWFLDYDGSYTWDGGIADKIAGWGPGSTPIPGRW